MFGRLRKGGALAAALALALVGVGASPALAADGDVTTYKPEEALLTKVVLGPEGADTSEDSYVFHFAGGGTVEEGDADSGQNADAIYADGVEQDATTLKLGDVVPTIANVTLNGFELSAGDALSNGQVAQGVVQKSIQDILDEQGVEFPHAGVYTYVVTETAVSLGTTSRAEGYYVNASQAEYTLRIRVINTKTGNTSEYENRDLTIEGVTLEQTKDENGDPIQATKIDPQYPTTTTDDGHKINETAAGVSPVQNTLAGDSRGRNVPGFTFANEYIKGGEFIVKKLYDGDHSDRTKYSTVELVVYSEAAKNPDALGACLTYVIEGDGIDKTENTDQQGEHRKLNGVYTTSLVQRDHYMADFDAEGFAYITADLKEDSVIRITGEFGPYNEEFANDPASQDGNKRMILSTSGLLVGQTYWVIERAPGDYTPTGYVYVGEDGTMDPRVETTGMTTTSALSTAATDPTDTSDSPKTIPAGALLLREDATGSATTVFVVNEIDESKVSPTGILINNLPYILMIGIPVAVFAVMFVSKRRRNAAA